MTFMHKLSRRLAMLKDRRWLLCAVAALACQLPDRRTGPTVPDPLSRLVLTPDIIEIRVNQTAMLDATGLDADGGPAATALSFEVKSQTGGRIIGTTVPGPGRKRGEFLSGGAPGRDTVVVIDTSGVADTAVVIVTPVPVTSVTVTPAAAAIQIGQTTQLTAVPRDSTGAPLTGRLVTWASTNPAVAAVNSSGLVAGVATGSVLVIATSEGMSGIASVAVSVVSVASVAVSPATAAILTGQTVQLTATPQDSSGAPLAGRPVTWTSSNAAIASVNATGLVSGIAAGSVIITATSEGKSATAAVAVSVVPVASVSVTPSSATVHPGTTVQLTATPRDSAGNPLTGRPVTWSSGNTARATVTSTGKVTGVAVGSVTITASSEGKNATSAISVTLAPVATVTVTPATATLAVGATQQLTATLRDSGGNTLTGRPIAWASTAPGVASVNASGLVTAAAAGSAAISATSEGKSDTTAVTVTATPPPPPPPPPPSGSDTVPLTIMRTGTGSGTVVVSSGIPLPPGLLQPGGTANVAVLVGGVEKAIYIEQLASRHRDGSLRSVLIQFQHSLTAGTPVAGLLIIGPSVLRTTTDRAKVAVVSMPAAVALPNSADYLVQTELVGPTITVAQSPFPTYENNFVQYGNQHWAVEQGDFYYGYYERSLAWFVYWARTGDAEYWRRGMLEVLWYRDQFLIPNGWYVQPHWMFLEAVGIHYLLTGDTQDLTGIGQAADDPFHFWWLPQFGLPDPEADARIAARTILVFIIAGRYGAPSAAGHNWNQAARQALNSVLSHQDADGGWRFLGTYYEQYNFMAGLLMDAMIKYTEWFEADARIPASVQRTLDYLWNTQWVSTAQAFRYSSGTSPLNDPPGPTPVADLNLLICHSYSWFYSLAPASRAAYKTRADQCFNGGIAGAWLDGHKQFNESYYLSYRHLYYRR